MYFFRLFIFTLCLSSLGMLGTAWADAPNLPTNDYLTALQTLNSFAASWANRNAAAGAVTVAATVRKKVGASALQTYFQGTSSPQHWAYEIGPGTLVRPGAYRFPIRLLSYLESGGGFIQKASPSQVTVSKSTDGRWYVANLP
jgi:hypothetical protein